MWTNSGQYLSESIPKAWQVLLLCGLFGLNGLAVADASVSTPVGYAESSPMADLPKAQAGQGPVTILPAPRLKPQGVPATGPVPADPALQNKHFSPSSVSPKTGFSGMGFSGYLPPDPNIAVGPNHVAQIVNSQFAVFSKTGVMASGYPKSLSSFWTPLGGDCATNNAGDPIVQYDRQADRWIITQLGSLNAPYSECIAVSTSGDPNASYHLYAYSFGTDLNDYPKFGVWPSADSTGYSGSAYLATYNLFANGTKGTGAAFCVYDRQAMINGGYGAQQICQTLSNEYSYLPSDLDGSTLPPQENGQTPAYFVTDDATTSSVRVQKATFSFGASPVLSLTATDLLVASFSDACGGGSCIPQPGTNRKLDSLGDRPMYRLAYRNFGATQSMVFNHAVVAGTSVGVRWYELKNSGSGFGVYQQGTYAPDSNYRWMGSMAMDKDGNIALGYSTSSGTIYPALRVASRFFSDAIDTLQNEQTLQTGGGSQTGYTRWGDYSSMRVDPSDDSTFWYTGEYYTTSSSYTWSTYIGSFTLTTAPATPDFSLSANPTLVTFPEMTTGSGTSTLSVTPQGGFNSNVTLDASACANNGFNWSISPTTVAPNGTATLTVSPSSPLPATTASCTISGTSGTLSHSVVVTARTLSDFTIAAANSSLTIVRGKNGSMTINVPKVATSSNVKLGISGLPNKTSASFSPNPVSTSSSSYSTLTIKVNKRAATTPGTTVTVTGSNGNYTHSTTFTLGIQ